MSPEEKRKHGEELVLAIVWLLIGALVTMWVIEKYAPRHPTVFCRPSANGCENYPWRP